MRPDLAHHLSTVHVLPPAGDGAVAVCEVSGEIDISNVDRLEDGLSSALRLGPGVVVDLSEVTFLASAGVRALFDAADNHPDRVLVLVTGRGVDTILRICGMAAVLPCRPDRSAAVEACRVALGAHRCA